jgi:hypothetical protein
LTLAIALSLEGCASTQPILYPNEHFNVVGSEAAERDVESCMALAESAGADFDGGRRWTGGSQYRWGRRRRGCIGRSGLRIGDRSGLWSDRRTVALDIQ